MSCRNSFDTAAWTSCDPGTLQELAGRLRTTRHRERVRRTVAPSIILLALMVGTWTASQAMWHFDSHYGGISCLEVQASLNLFESGRLPDALNKKMAAHLRECPRCQSQLRDVSQQPDEVGTAPLFNYSMLASMRSVR